MESQTAIPDEERTAKTLRLMEVMELDALFQVGASFRSGIETKLDQKFQSS